MKSARLFAIAATILVGGLFGGAASAARPMTADGSPGTFSDDDGGVHEPYIEAIAAAGITGGCNPPANDRYCGPDDVTRGEMAAFLDRALDLPTTNDDSFIDDDGTLFEDPINRLAAAGITGGCNPPANDRYCGPDDVTRGEMATFLGRALDLQPRDPTPLGGSSCDPAYDPCVPPVEEVGDLNCPAIRKVYPDGVSHDVTQGDPHRLNADGDDRACEPVG